MKKSGFIITILVLIIASYSPRTTAQPNAAPPPLMKQIVPQVPTAAPQNAPPPTPEALPSAPVVQTVPLKILLSSVSNAVHSAQMAVKLLRPGKIWVVRGLAGEYEIKSGLLYQGVVVAVLNFDPGTGVLLPLGVNPHIYQLVASVETLGRDWPAILRNIKVLPFAEFIQPEVCWSFPLAYKNVIVAHLKVYYDGIHIMQDFVASQEMNAYGQ